MSEVNTSETGTTPSSHDHQDGHGDDGEGQPAPCVRFVVGQHRAAAGGRGVGHGGSSRSRKRADRLRRGEQPSWLLTFGGFLLLGGRIADFWGRKRTYLVGAAGFAVASAVGGLAVDEEMLFIARAAQGAFGALLGPASLALLTVLFTDSKERAKAFAVYGAIAGGGSAVGLLLGGVLTEYADWRWCFWVNVPVAVVAIVAAIPFVPESRAPGDSSYDVPGALLITVGLASVVYGFTRVAQTSQSNAAKGLGTSGWSDPWALLAIGLGVLLVAAFVAVELRVRNPCCPCGWCSIATAAAPTSPRRSWAPG